jgi:hypothetical protein
MMLLSSPSLSIGSVILPIPIHMWCCHAPHPYLVVLSSSPSLSM